MDNSLYLIYSIFDIHNIKNKKKEDIYKYIKLYVLFLSNYNSKDATINFLSHLADFEEYIKNGYFYDDEYIKINKKHECYIIYNEKKNKCSKKINDFINCLILNNKSQEYIVFDSEDVDEDANEDVNEDANEDVNEDVDEDVNEDVDEDVNEDVYEDVNEDIDEDDSDDEEISNISLLSKKSLSINNSSNDEIIVIHSLSDVNKFYFINKDLTSCSCEAYKYCKLDIKYCKHLEELNNNIENNNTFIINKNDKSCNCPRFNSHNNCKHITKYMKEL